MFVSQVLDWAKLSPAVTPELWSEQTNKFVEAAYWAMFGTHKSDRFTIVDSIARSGRTTLVAAIALHKAMNTGKARIELMADSAEHTSIQYLCQKLPSHLQPCVTVHKHHVVCSRVAKSSFDDFLRVIDLKLNDEQKKYVDVLSNPRFTEESSGIFVALAILKRALMRSKEETGCSFPLPGRRVGDILAELTAGHPEFYVLHNRSWLFCGDSAIKARAKAKPHVWNWNQMTTSSNAQYVSWKITY